MYSAKIERVRKFYNRTYRIYDLLLTPFFHSGRKEVSDAILKNGGRTLDLGCHSGQLARMLKDIPYRGVDISELAIQKAERNALPNQKFVTEELSKVLNESDTYQNYCLLYTLSVTPDSNALLQTLADKMKTGQRLYIVNHFSSSIWRKKLANALDHLGFLGFHFYFPLNRAFLSKHYNFVAEKKTAFLWTFLELERK